jgi:hypothetical protein
MPLLSPNNDALRIVLDAAILFVRRSSDQAGTLPEAR